MDDPRLTSTSYAILGMVGMRPCTTYELGVAMQRSFDYFWPRARSLVYREVKRLATLGLLDATRDLVGRRPRTTYRITEAGREALAEWLRSPPQAFSLEVEALLRLYLAPFGDRQDLLDALQAVRRDADRMLGIAAAFQRAYLDGTSPFMDQVHLRALLNDFLANYAQLVHDWSERSLATVGGWSDLDPGGKGAAALALIGRLPPHAAGLAGTTPQGAGGRSAATDSGSAQPTTSSS